MAKSQRAWKLALLCLLALLAWLWASDSTPVLNLSTLQQQRAELLDWHAQSPWAVRASFFALYLVCAALSLPGVAVLTLAAGALLGFGWGLVLVSFASSLGATLSFLLARYALRDLVQARMGPRVVAMQARLTREGAIYLLSLRLIPLVPFGLINLAMGLTSMPTRTFYVVSQVGMLASTEFDSSTSSISVPVDFSLATKSRPKGAEYCIVAGAMRCSRSSTAGVKNNP